MKSFVYESAPARILFGTGQVANVGAEIARLGCSRALILSTAFQKPDAEGLADRIGGLAAGILADARMHTPIEATESAMDGFRAAGADCVLSLGGGSTIGLGKAISWRNGAPHLVVPTTYAGSEVTDILGQTENGVKTTVRDPRIRPAVVIYDPALTLGLPVAMSVSSALNAMAHAVEGLYAQDANPVTSLMAVEGMRALRSALPAIVREPTDPEARSEALYGSWLCGTVLGSVGMSLHHKLCHTLGGAFDLPHAETHAILLPHTAAYNARAAAEQLRPAAALFGGDLGGGLHDLAVSLGAPTALGALGMRMTDLGRAADLAVKNPYQNPREVTREEILELLSRAFSGSRPAAA